MGKQDELKREKRWIVIAFSIGAAVGSLYGAFILGPALGSTMEGTAIGIAIGIGAGVSLGAFLDSRDSPEKINKRESKLLIMVVIATLILVLSTAFMAYSSSGRTGCSWGCSATCQCPGRCRASGTTPAISISAPSRISSA